MSRETPSEVARQLRQESGFGCVKCGHPYIEYHHIVEYHREPHFRPNDMMAVCGNCHREVAKLGHDIQREFKANPFNKKNGKYQGALVYDKRDLIFKVGGNWYENVPNILVYKGVPIISCEIKEGQAKVSLNLFNEFNKPVLQIAQNEIVFRIDDLWDFEYKHNYAIARYASRKIAIEMDFRQPEATITGSIWLGQRLATLGSEETSLPSQNIFKHNRISNCPNGIFIW